MAYLKLQPHVQTSVATRPNQKLAFKFYGPFIILKKVGSVAYKLQLPSSAQIHPVVHVSQLKKHVPPQTAVSADIPDANSVSETVPQPTNVPECALIPSARATAFKIRVQWGSQPDSLITLEDENDLRKRFLGAPVWGQAAS